VDACYASGEARDANGAGRRTSPQQSTTLAISKKFPEIYEL
jgi:hypothetical protein